MPFWDAEKLISLIGRGVGGGVHEKENINDASLHPLVGIKKVYSYQVKDLKLKNLLADNLNLVLTELQC